MARKQTSFPTHSGLFIIVASCLLVISSCRSMSVRSLSEDRRLKAKVYVGVEIFQMAIKQVFPAETNLNLELNGTLFERMVCPLFGHYSRYYQTLQSLPEGDSRYTNISLIVHVSEKLTEVSCEHVKTQCREDQECANMRCNISSISKACLTVPSKNDLSTEMDENIELLGTANGDHEAITKSWLEQISNRTNMTSTVVTLAPEGIMCSTNGGVMDCGYSYSF